MAGCWEVCGGAEVTHLIKRFSRGGETDELESSVEQG